MLEFYASGVNLLSKGKLSMNLDMMEMVAKAAENSIAYVDDRKGLRDDFGFDFWLGEGCTSLREELKYASSQQFPDFLMKTALVKGQLINGSVLELKDSKGGSISSFNSTIPSKTKSLDEIDLTNQTDLVSKIASCKDADVSAMSDYRKFQRNCFYMVRTHRGSDKVKLSLVHGSFFETIPKEKLFYQMFLNALHGNLSKKDIQISPEIMKEVENVFSYMNDQTIIASSQNIEKASVKPRFMITADVHRDANPHGNSYDIPEQTFNLIIPEYLYSHELKKRVLRLNGDISQIEIQHKRNGIHFVFSYPVKI